MEFARDFYCGDTQLDEFPRTFPETLVFQSNDRHCLDMGNCVLRSMPVLSLPKQSDWEGRANIIEDVLSWTIFPVFSRRLAIQNDDGQCIEMGNFSIAPCQARHCRNSEIGKFGQILLRRY